MSWLKKALISIGIAKIHSFPEPYNYNINIYDLSHLSDKDKIEVHRDFLKSLMDDENNRQNFIENKTSQIISQTSIIFSLVGLFIPIIIDKSGESSLFLRILIISMVVIAFIFYFLSISNALKNFDVIKFRYSKPTPFNVLTFKDKSIEEFNAELVRDYLYCINKNVVLNNIKATNLLHSHNTFKLANATTAITIICLCIGIFFLKDKDEVIKIENPIKIEKIDSILNKMQPIFKHDTIIIHDTVISKNIEVK